MAKCKALRGSMVKGLTQFLIETITEHFEQQEFGTAGVEGVKLINTAVEVIQVVHR